MSANDLTFLPVLGYSSWCPIGHLADNDEPNQQVFYLLLLIIVGVHISDDENAEII